MKSKPSIEQRLFQYVLLAGLPSATLALWALSHFQISWAIRTLIGIVLYGKIFYIAYMCRSRTNFRLRTLSNLLEAITNGDYSLRGRTLKYNASDEDAYSELVTQINQLADTLLSQRLEAKESQLLLAKVMNNIAIALVAVDNSGRVVHVNKAFCSLIGKAPEELLSTSMASIGLNDLLHCEVKHPVVCDFPNNRGRFSIYRDEFIENGETHQLLLISDVKDMLRSEEQQAWQKLIRVIGHEINNSLTPISSLSASLQKMADDPSNSEMLKNSLGVIHQRSQSLVKLVSGYKDLAKIPSPKLSEMDLVNVLNKIALLYPKLSLLCGAHEGQWKVNADAGLVEQVLINLIKNAQESHAQKYGEDPERWPKLEIAFKRLNSATAMEVKDHGTGIANLTNVFVPFYSTKPNGSGIGLALSRQIMEAHGGELNVFNRGDVEGVCAQLVFRED